MKVFFYYPESRDDDLRRTIRMVTAALEHAGITVITPHQPPLEQPRSSESSLDRMDALIIEGSNADAEVGYLLAFSIPQKKPVLYLSPKGKSRHNPLATFERTNRVPSNIVLARYDERTVERVVLGFLGRLDVLAALEAPTIKFTLRITPSIERYLEWKAKQRKLSKADLLREMLQKDIIPADAEFKRWMRKREDKQR